MAVHVRYWHLLQQIPSDKLLHQINLAWTCKSHPWARSTGKLLQQYSSNLNTTQAAGTCCTQPPVGTDVMAVHMQWMRLTGAHSVPTITSSPNQYCQQCITQFELSQTVESSVAHTKHNKWPLCPCVMQALGNCCPGSQECYRSVGQATRATKSAVCLQTAAPGPSLQRDAY